MSSFTTPVAVGPFAFEPQTIHFQYLPAAALIVVPARVLGDVRVMSVLAFAALFVFAVRLAWESPDGRTRALRVLALCLALPTTVAVVHWGWVDVYSVVGLAGWVALRRTHQRWATACLVLCFTVKPLILIALVPALVWSRPARREIAVAAVLGAALILPFILITGAGSFYQDVVGIQAGLGFRYDALTLSAYLHSISGQVLPVWAGAAAGLTIAFFTLRRRPSDVSDVLIAAAILSTVAFLLAKWAFFNYYCIPGWLLVLAIAGRGVRFDEEADIALPALLRWRPAARHAVAHLQGQG
jgi:hypothetical protein